MNHVLLALACCVAVPAVAAQTTTEWREDLAVYREQVPRTHLAPFNTVSRQAFEGAVDALAARVEGLSRAQIVVELARITAMLGDGHTGLGLTPNSANRFRQVAILPYWMDGSLYVLGVDARHARLAGGRIVRVGSTPAAEALDRVAPLISRDNLMGVRDLGGRYLAIPEVLFATGLSDSPDRASYTIARPGGGEETITLEAIPDAWLSNLSSRPWLQRTANDRIAFTMAYDTAAPPRWLQHPGDRFGMTPLPDRHAVYVQINAIQNGPRETMEDFVGRVFAAVDSLRPERLVIDLRLNGGGNNFLNTPLILGLVRRPWLDQRGRVFVLISRHTFSAASHLVTYLERFTNAVFVGEPTGGSPNHYGDAVAVELPHSGLRVRASTIFWQNSLPMPFETRDWTPPDLAAPLTIDTYRNGRDPALELALRWTPQPTLASRLRDAIDRGSVADAVRMHAAFRADPVNAYADNESSLNTLGYDLLGEGQMDGAVTVFRLNADDHPASANAFDSLGDGLLASGDTTAAVVAWRRALAIDPEFAASAANLQRLGFRP